MMKWGRRLVCAAFLLSLVSAMAFFDRALRPHPEQTPPRELYAVVQRHLSACRWADFPLAYHTTSNSTQERFSLVQYENKLRQDYLPVADAQHIEFGAVHHLRNNKAKVLVDVYFISRHGEASGWTYTLIFEDEDWKIDSAEPIPGWPSGQRLSGLRA